MRPTLKATELIAISSGLLSFCTNLIYIAEKLHQLRRSVAHIDTLILPVLIDVVELAEHSEKGHMRPRIVNNSFRSVFD